MGMLENPLPFMLFNFNGKIELGQPRFLGSGGGGAVFAFTPINSIGVDFVESKEEIVVKVSWLQSTASVEKFYDLASATLLQELQAVESRGECLPKEIYD